ncbi:alpha/beta hydrolase [Azorhizobium doebereinerae]|uniref:alpha/beta hydrolase n=1 Tax=Azorhizobium doebereinerae TaxID=281091 RepID=UPI0006876C5B|nr:alpha/beta hydrolase [Azorhizobium doebereinerae]
MLAACMVSLAGCASRPGPDSLLPTTAEAPGATKQVVLVATTRARDAKAGTLFGGERASDLDFATVDLSVPPTHKAGAIEFPSQAPGNPATDMVVHEAIYRDTEQDFVRDLNAQLARLPAGQRKVLVFVHGYNTTFSEALYRLTQIAYDAKTPGVPVLFSWASRGKTEDYVYDNNSATAARDNLERTLGLVAASNAEEITILAHSMGNWVTVEALRQMKISGRMIPSKRIGNVILAAPDIDVDVFKTQLRRFGKPEKPFIVIVSRDDKALGISDFLAGGKLRLGNYTNDAELVSLGAMVVDMSNVKAMDDMNHGKFAQLIGQGGKMREELEKEMAANGGAVPSQINVDGVRISGIDARIAASAAQKASEQQKPSGQ